MLIVTGVPPTAFGPADAHLGELVRQHDERVADLELGVADLAVGAGHAHPLLGAEDLGVELDRVRAPSTHRYGVTCG